MTLTTKAWEDGGRIPVKHAQPGHDVSPALSWSAAPEGTSSFVLLMHDVDAATGNGLDDVLHWMVWNLPATLTSLPEGIPQGGQRADGSRQISVSGRTIAGRRHRRPDRCITMCSSLRPRYADRCAGRWRASGSDARRPSRPRWLGTCAKGTLVLFRRAP
jgi:hypothetical protein